jgi:hypothetical protein
MSREHVTVYRVRAGTLTRLYYAEHHAEQLARALRLHGLEPVVDTIQLPDDPLTRLTVQS